MDIVNIEGRTGLVRDLSSGAILNTNQSDYDNFLQKKKREDDLRVQAEHQQQEINSIRTELSDIKQLLLDFIKRAE